jgi:hypothetical protein
MTDIQKWAIDAVYEEKSATGTYYLCADVDPVIEKLETENSVQRHQIAYLESELAKSKENARITLSCNDDLKVRLSELEAIVEQIQLAANTNGFDSIQALIEHLPFLANAETEISRLQKQTFAGRVVHAHVVWAIEPKELEGKFIYAEPKPAQGIPDGWVIE